ncbi:MAG: Ig-like domain-containing protein, partial [Candidatus Acidiferrales bacterium]
TTLISISGAVSLTGAGAVTLSSASGGTPAINEAATASTLTNVSNTIQGVGQIGNNGLAVVNQGTINANVAGTLLINPVTLTNQGLLAAAAGATLQLSNAAITNTGGTMKVDGTMSVPTGFTVNGGILSGSGTISGSIVLGPATISQPGDAPLPGILTINGSGTGNYTQGSSAAFTALINGTTAGTQYSQLNLTGAASLSGTFSVMVANGFTPTAGAQFTIINAASVTGQFTSSNFPNLPAGLVWNVIYNPTSVVLVAAAPASIAVTPVNPSIAVNATLQFTATATFAGGGTQDITNSVTWASSMPSVATINSTGLATGVTAGQSTTISAMLGNVVGSTTLSVTGSGTPALTQVSPNTGGQGQQNLSLAITGQSTHFAQASTTANFGAGITVASLTINSPTSATAVINIAQSATLGARTVTLTTGNEMASLTNGFTVTALTLNSIAITPNPPPSIGVGATEQFTATGTFSDGSTQNLTSSATWVSSMPGLATISNATATRGLATGVAAGTTTITASVSGVTSPGVSLTVTGTGPTLTSISVAPPTASVAANNTQQFTATGHFSDGSAGPVTVNWASSNMAVATINAAGLASGVAVGGPIAITATSVQTPSISGTAQLTVTAAPPTLTSITVAPPTASIAVNATQTFTATGHFSDGSSGPVTVNWTSSNMAIATINPAGVASGVSAGGPITITATSTQTPSVNGAAQLTVTGAPPTLTSITVAPPAASIAVNATQTFTATGHFSDGSSGPVTVNWTSSNMAIATINPAGMASGVSAGGPITITATSTQTPSVSGTAQLTVTAAPPVLTSITVAPASTLIAVDATQSFTATGHFSDGSSAAVTVTWTSSNNAVATINAVGTAMGISAGGPITITATSTQLTNISGTAQLIVTGVALTSIAVNPANPSALTGTTLQFHATGTYADNSTKDITATVIWASSNTEAATIVAGGLANLLAGGQTTISATLGEISGNTLLTVTIAPFTLTVSPPPPGQPAVPVVAPGGTVAFGLVLTPVPGFNGTVQFACTTTNPTITCAPDPSSVTLTPSSPSNVAIVLNTFCKGTTTTAQQSPSGFGGGLMLLILTLTCGGAAFFYRRRQAWALSFAVLVLIALGSTSCGGIPKGPNGPTQPGEVTVTVTASADGATVTAPPLQLIVE